MVRLKGKAAIITGAARGLGGAMAQRFVSEGARVIAADVMPLTYETHNVEFFKTDISNTKSCEKLFNHALEKYGALDILVNNAGITRDALTRKMTDDMWNAVLTVNLTGIFNLTRLIGPHMQQAGKGSIINISSVVGVFGNIGQANYAATKAGVIGLTKSWAKEFAMKGGNVRVNAIAPGYIMTDILKTVPQELLEKFAKMTMLGRLGQPQEIANVALFLASDEASYLTGQIIQADGGMRL